MVMARERSHVTVCTVGHFGGGKSTVSGRLMVATGSGREMAASSGGVRAPGDDNAKDSSGEIPRDDITALPINYAWVRSRCRLSPSGLCTAPGAPHTAVTDASQDGSGFHSTAA